MRRLERMHPAVCFAYLFAVLGLTAFAGSPVAVLESLTGALLLAALSDRLHGAGWYLVIALAAALANFAFVHNGETALFFVGDAAFTLEALLYGAFTGVMLAAVCMWGNCSVRFLPSDKYIWLLGRALPSAGLVLSCAVRFIPMFIRRTREYNAVLAGENPTLKDHLRAFSASLGRSAEQAMDSAVSMRARGYGTSRRTSFSVYRLTAGTVAALCGVFSLTAACIALTACGAGGFWFYPAVSEIGTKFNDMALYCGFGALCLLPSAVAVYERIRYG